MFKFGQDLADSIDIFALCAGCVNCFGVKLDFTASRVSHSASELQQKVVLATYDSDPCHLYGQCHVLKIKVFRKPRAETS